MSTDQHLFKTAADLQPGDFIRRAGGNGYHRYAVNARVASIKETWERGGAIVRWVSFEKSTSGSGWGDAPLGFISTYPVLFDRAADPAEAEARAARIAANRARRADSGY